MASKVAAPSRDVAQWLLRMHDASRTRSYVGTFVVMAAGASLSSARIWHAHEGNQQIERIESLTGTPRTTYRHNDQVVTFLPEQRVVRTERREALTLFPGLLQSAGAATPQLAQFYLARATGTERVAGFAADVVQLAPKDALRHGYRIWMEQASGLAVKLQTLDGDGRVLEEAAFSQLELDPPLRLRTLARQMAATSGWRVERPALVRMAAADAGWSLRGEVPGFKPMDCWRRSGQLPSDASSAAGALPLDTLQCIYSDGLATVSLFIQPYDVARHPREIQAGLGATQTLARRLDGGWWLTAVGEVPATTLQRFAAQMVRRP